MSIRKLLLSASVALAFLGMQGTGASALASDSSNDGVITAKEVRSLIVKVSGATKRRDLDPRAAMINVGQIVVRSASCAKGSNWKTYSVTSTLTRGKLCNGSRRSNQTRNGSRYYFQRRMVAIMNRIFSEANLKRWGPGQVISISSNGEVASLYYSEFGKSKKAKKTGKMLRVVGSRIILKDLE